MKILNRRDLPSFLIELSSYSLVTPIQKKDENEWWKIESVKKGFNPNQLRTERHRKCGCKSMSSISSSLIDYNDIKLKLMYKRRNV
jgi:hypothetical protein